MTLITIKPGAVLHHLGYMPLLISVFLLCGCAQTIFLAPSYEPLAGIKPLFPPDRQPSIQLVITGYDEHDWFATDRYTFLLRDTPSVILHDALTKELSAMGMHMATDGRQNTARLEAAIRWFAPLGEDYRWTGIILSFALYEKGQSEPVWRGKTEGAAGTKRPYFLIAINPAPLEDAMVRAVQKALRELNWNAGFNRAVKRLADQGTRHCCDDGLFPQE